MFFDPVRADPAAIAHHGVVLSRVCADAETHVQDIRREVQRLRLLLEAAVTEASVAFAAVSHSADPASIAAATKRLAQAEVALNEFNAAAAPLLHAAARVVEASDQAGLGVELITAELDPALRGYQETHGGAALPPPDSGGDETVGGMPGHTRALSATFLLVPLNAVDLPAGPEARRRSVGAPTLALFDQLVQWVLPALAGKPAGSVLRIPAAAVPPFDACYGEDNRVKVRPRPAGRYAVVEGAGRIADALLAGLDVFPADVHR